MAVFDGHAGQQVAQMASSKLHSNVISQGLLPAVSVCKLSTARLISSVCWVYFCNTNNKCALASASMDVCFNCAWVQTMTL